MNAEWLPTDLGHKSAYKLLSSTPTIILWYAATDLQFETMRLNWTDLKDR